MGWTEPQRISDSLEYGRILRYSSFTVNVVLMRGQKLSVAVQLQRRPRRLCKPLNCRPRSYFNVALTVTTEFAHIYGTYMYAVIVIVDASRVQSCYDRAVCGRGSSRRGLARSTCPKAAKTQSHKAGKVALYQ
jgi:hypothetical protein